MIDKRKAVPAREACHQVAASPYSPRSHYDVDIIYLNRKIIHHGLAPAVRGGSKKEAQDVGGSGGSDMHRRCARGHHRSHESRSNAVGADSPGVVSPGVVSPGVVSPGVVGPDRVYKALRAPRAQTTASTSVLGIMAMGLHEQGALPHLLSLSSHTLIVLAQPSHCSRLYFLTTCSLLSLLAPWHLNTRTRQLRNWHVLWPPHV